MIKDDGFGWIISDMHECRYHIYIYIGHGSPDSEFSIGFNASQLWPQSVGNDFQEMVIMIRNSTNGRDNIRWHYNDSEWIYIYIYIVEQEHAKTMVGDCSVS